MTFAPLEVVGKSWQREDNRGQPMTELLSRGNGDRREKDGTDPGEKKSHRRTSTGRGEKRLERHKDKRF